MALPLAEPLREGAGQTLAGAKDRCRVGAMLGCKGQKQGLIGGKVVKNADQEARG
jgi:hypothetical protein